MPKGFYGARNWTAAQLETLHDLFRAGRTDAEIARRVGKTLTAVEVKRKRLGLGVEARRTLTSRELARRMGVSCSKTVKWWIEQGWLRATKGVGAGAHRQWRITEQAVYDFLAKPEHQHRWDVSRITDAHLRAYALDVRHAERYLTTGEVARRFYTCHKSVWQWINRGHLPAVRHANWLIPESALVGFVPPNERPRGGYKKRLFTPDEDALLLRLRESGVYWPQIARLMGRHQGSVVGRWKRLSNQAVPV